MIQKQNTHLREAILAEEKLAVTLKYLAKGETFSSLMYQYRIHKSTISQFVSEVYKVIYSVPDYMKLPSLKEEWEYLIEQTNERWRLPICFAAVDGKHVGIICPKHSGSEFYNYKGFYSIVLQHGFTALFYSIVLQHGFTALFYSVVLQHCFTTGFYSMVLQHCFTAWFYSIVLPAFADYSYRFLKAEVGCEGRISVYRSSNFYSALKKQQLNLPEPHPIPRSSEPFWESTHRTKPFGFKNASDMERIFDYRQFRFNRK